MDWIFEHFQLVILVALALGSLVKRSLETKAAAEAERQARGGSQEREDESVDEDEDEWAPVRPVAAPPQARTSGPPPLRPASVASVPAEAYQNSVILKQQREMQEQLRKIREVKVASATTITGGAVATRTRVSAAQRHGKTVQPVKSGLRASLHQRKETRRAILMREILGPPVGLR